jgi:hypothetical protein
LLGARRAPQVALTFPNCGKTSEWAGLLLGVAYAFAAWGAGIGPCDNLFVATLLGLTVGLGTVGWRESTTAMVPGKA